MTNLDFHDLELHPPRNLSQLEAILLELLRAEHAGGEHRVPAQGELRPQHDEADLVAHLRLGGAGVEADERGRLVEGGRIAQVLQRVQGAGDQPRHLIAEVDHEPSSARSMRS